MRESAEISRIPTNHETVYGDCMGIRDPVVLWHRVLSGIIYYASDFGEDLDGGC